MNRFFGSTTLTLAVSTLVASSALLAQEAAVKVQAPAAKQERKIVETKTVITKEVVVGKKAVDAKAAKVQDVQKAVVIRRAMVGAPQGVEEHLKNVEAQYAQQFRPILKNELYFLKGVCALNDDQVKRITPEGEKALKDAVAKSVEVQRAMMTGRWRQDLANPDTRKLIQDSLLVATKSHLSPEQSGLYAAEVAKRMAARKQAVIGNMVVKLDLALILSAEQRGKIAEALGSHWNEMWAQSLDSFQYGDQYVPNLPDNLVSPHLNKIQKTIWQGAQKINYWGNGMNQMVQEVEDLEPAPVAAVKAQVRDQVKAIAPAPAAKVMRQE